MSFDIIAAVDAKWGLSVNGVLPWRRTPAGHEDMLWFKTKTTNNVIIMGRKTWESIPGRPLENRMNIVVSSSHTTNTTIQGILTNSPIITVGSFEAALEFYRGLKYDDKFTSCFVIGGATIYKQALRHPQLRNAYITVIKEDYNCDLQFPHKYLKHAIITNITTEHRVNEYYKYDYTNVGEQSYLNLLNELLAAPKKPNRTNVAAHSISHAFLTMPLCDGRGSIIPLLTTKKMMWKSIYHELIWFLRGDTNIEYLRENNVHIWDANTTREFLDSRGLSGYDEGDVGPIYGYQWRKWNAFYSRNYKSTIGIDQIAEVITMLKTDPWSRRMIVSAWNPSQIHEMALPPCHTHFQFNVDPDKDNNAAILNCLVTMRSADVFCGLPFNCASYALLTHIIAHIVGLTAGKLTISICDAHLYVNAIEQARLQLTRRPMRFPTIRFSKLIKSFESVSIDDFINKFTINDIIIEGYDPADYIKVDMVV